MITYRTLTDADFPQVYRATHDAFSDYAVPYQADEDRLRRMFQINGVRFEFSVGAFDGEKMVGFTINAIGDWNGRRTVYDSGTGVIPEYRRRGISREMFEFILPLLRENKIEQYLLEVIINNEPAVKLYRNLNFQITRRLSVFKRPEAMLIAEKSNEEVEIKELETLDWDLLESFWTYIPSWQNSIDAMKRSLSGSKTNGTFLGLYSNGKLIGYGIVFHNSGNIPQIAVAEDYRGKGFGRAVLNALQRRTEKPLLISNADETAENIAAFAVANGFSLLTTQYEMLLNL